MSSSVNEVPVEQAATPENAAPVFLTAAWRSLVMLNFEIDSTVLEPYVPTGTELDLWQDRALVSFVGFRFLGTRLFGWRVPRHGDFDEINLRFYVRRLTPDGWRRGVVFLKEVVARPAVTRVAKWFYNENYVTLPVTHEFPARSALAAPEQPDCWKYRWGPRGAELQMVVTVVGPAQPPVPGTEAEFITEHYWGYTRQRDGLTLEYAVEHPPWKVWDADTAELSGDPTPYYGATFREALMSAPSSAFLVDGSEVVMRRGGRI